MGIKSVHFLFAVSLCLSGCVSAQVMPLAANVVRIDTIARGVFAQGKAVPETMTLAARETLARNFTHFRLSDPALGQGTDLSGGNAVALNRGMAEGAAVTVTMFHEGEPGAKNAFDARQVLKQYQVVQ